MSNIYVILQFKKNQYLGKIYYWQPKEKEKYCNLDNIKLLRELLQKVSILVNFKTGRAINKYVVPRDECQIKHGF